MGLKVKLDLASPSIRNHLQGLVRRVSLLDSALAETAGDGSCANYESTGDDVLEMIDHVREIRGYCDMLMQRVDKLVHERIEEHLTS